MAEVQAVSMAGGTIRRKLIRRESFRASVLHHSDDFAVQKRCAGEVLLDNAFVLIERHPASGAYFHDGSDRYDRPYLFYFRVRNGDAAVGPVDEPLTPSQPRKRRLEAMDLDIAAGIYA